MLGRSARFVGVLLGVFVALLLAAAPTFASGSAGQAVQFPGVGVGNWNTITSGNPLEFDLAYPGNNEGANVTLASNPSSQVGFAVYTDQAWKQLGAGNTDIKPIGFGTSNPNEGGNLSWKVGASTPELYHIQVYKIGMGSATFWINQQGSGGSQFYAVSPLPVQLQAQAPVIVYVPAKVPCCVCTRGSPWVGWAAGCR